MEKELGTIRNELVLRRPDQNSEKYSISKIVNLRFVFAATSANNEGTSNIVFFQISLDLKIFGNFEKNFRTNSI